MRYLFALVLLLVGVMASYSGLGILRSGEAYGRLGGIWLLVLALSAFLALLAVLAGARNPAVAWFARVLLLGLLLAYVIGKMGGW